LARLESFSEELEQRVEARTAELHAARDQLVHREKLAALGQLTAGIAHEIKNPLNFVNNFAAVSQELIEEFPEDIRSRGDVTTLLEDLRGNLGRIREHGKRADNIVTGMMLHAREGSREKRAIDLHTILDEAVELAYHSTRAQLPDFQASFAREYDASLPMISVLPQDISRVFLNLLSNAIDAVYARSKASGDGFAGLITLRTRRDGDWVEVCIRDNGIGIPPEARDRLFNPFFTTKPVGKGTGLGLSLSHGIVVKAHGGMLSLGDCGGEGTEFTVRLPLQQTVADLQPFSGNDSSLASPAR
jgi:signal transduction histidine kinase